jgi:hypothetical protein
VTRLAATVLVLSALVGGASRAAAADFAVVPVKVSLNLREVVVGTVDFDSTLGTKLSDKDLLNLALGRPLGTKIDKATEVLAVALSFGPATAKLVVFDPSKSGSAAVTTTVAQITGLDFDVASVAGGALGQGVANVVIGETTLGDPAHDALHATTALVTGTGKLAPTAVAGPELKIAIKGLVAGRVSFTTTKGGQPTTFNGLIVNGKAKVAGKVLGLFSE